MPRHIRELLLISVLALPVIAGEESGNNDEPSTIMKAASSKRGAIVTFQDEKLSRSSNGCFIDPDGLAVLDVLGLSGTKVPRFKLADGTELGTPRLKYIDANAGLVFARFRHRPKVWIEPRREPVPLRSVRIAILSPTGPPLIGPAWARVSYVAGHNLRPQFQTVMSIAAGIPRTRLEFATGAPVIDQNGQLCGIFLGSRSMGLFQQQLAATPADEWLPAIAEARKASEGIPLPLPAELNPIDPAANHPDFMNAVESLVQGDAGESARHLSAALKDHPRSYALAYLQLELAAKTQFWDLETVVDTLKPSQGAGVVEQIHYLSWLGAVRARKNDSEGSEKAYIEAIRLSPDNYSPPRACYSELLESKESWDEALRETSAAVKSSPENLELLYRLKRLLGRKQLWDEEQEVTEEIDLLEKLYRPG